jgi:hypothetical protein
LILSADESASAMGTTHSIIVAMTNIPFATILIVLYIRNLLLDPDVPNLTFGNRLTRRLPFMADPQLDFTVLLHALLI